VTYRCWSTFYSKLDKTDLTDIGDGDLWPAGRRVYPRLAVTGHLALRSAVECVTHTAGERGGLLWGRIAFNRCLNRKLSTK